MTALLNRKGPDVPSLERLEAAVMTELALGTERREIAALLMSLAVSVLAEFDHGGGVPARDLADKLREIARKVDV